MGQDRKTMLAALLAVKRGFVTPAQAMELLAEAQASTEKEAAGQSAAAQTPAPSQAMQTILAASPDRAFEAELASAMENPVLALEQMGVPSTVREGLMHEPPPELLHQTLLSVAAVAPPPPPPPATLPPGKRYEIRNEHARGGMGRILIAIDNTIGREVALKELLPMGKGSTGNGFTPASNSRDATERFLREAKVTGKLEHPNIVPVYEIGQSEDGRLFYTMKFVRGHSLAVALRKIAGDRNTTEREKLQARLKLLESFQGVCDAMAYAHSRGVIHRDLKPANIMLGDFGETLVLDWGLARVKGDTPEVARKGDTTLPSLKDADSGTLTMDGSVMGTPAYMPPEQAQGKLSEIDERSDVYALGAILYELLTGRSPYEAPSGNEILEMLLHEPPKPVLEACEFAPPELAALCEKAMARDRASRLQSAGQLADEIRAFRDGRTLGVYHYTAAEMLRRFVSRHRAAVATVCVAVLVLIGIATAAFVRIGRARDRAMEAEVIATQQKAQAEKNEAEARRLSAEAQQSRTRAEEEAERAKASERKSRLAYAESLLREGERLEALGDWDAAREVYKGSAAIFDELGETPVLANLWMAYADSYGPRTLGTLGNDDPAWGSHGTSTISSDGRYIVRAAYRQVSVFDVDQGVVSMSRRVGVFAAGSVAIIEPAGIVAAMTSESLRTIGIADGARLYSDDEPRMRPQRVAVSRDGKRVLARDGLRFAVYETEKFAQLAFMDKTPPPSGPVPAMQPKFDQLAISPDGLLGLAMQDTDRNGPALLLDLSDAALAPTDFRPEGQTVHAAVFTASDRALLALRDGRLLDWSFAQNQALGAVRVSNNALHLLAFDGERVACIDSAGTAYWGSLAQVFGTGGFFTLKTEVGGQAVALRQGQDLLVLSTPLRPWLVYDLKDGTRKPGTAPHAAESNCRLLANGSQVLSAGLDGQLILWDVHRRASIRKSVPLPQGGLRLLAVDALETYALLAWGEGQYGLTELLRVDLADFAIRWRRPAKVQFGSTAAISPLGDLLVAPGPDGRPRLIYADDGSDFKILNWRETNDSLVIRISQRGQHCVIAGRTWVRRYQMADGALVSECAVAVPGQSSLDTYDISPDLETVLAYDSYSGRLLRVSSTTGAVTQSRTMRPQGHECVRYRDNGTIVVMDVSQRLICLDATTLDDRSALDISTRIESTANLGFSPFAGDGRLCAIQSRDGFMLLADLGGPMVMQRDPATSQPTAVYSNRAGTHAIACYLIGDQRAELAVWDNRDGRLLQVWQGEIGFTQRVAVSDDGSIAVSADSRGGLTAWQVGKTQPVGHTVHADKAAYVLCEFSPEGALHTISWDGVVRRHAWPSLEVERTWVAGRQRSVSAAGLDFTHQVAFTHNYFGPVLAIDLATDSIVFRRPRHRDAYQAMALSPDGAKVALLAAEDSLEVWDFKQARSLYRRSRSSAGMAFHSQVGWLAGGRLLLTPVTEAAALDLWDVERGALLRRFAIPEGSPTSLRVADDGTWLVCGREGSVVSVWRKRPELGESPKGADFVPHGLFGLALGADPNGPALWHALAGDVAAARELWQAELGATAARDLGNLHHYRLADRALARGELWQAFLQVQRARLADTSLDMEAMLARCIGSRGSRGFMTSALTQAARRPGANPELPLLLGRLLLDEGRAGHCERVLKEWSDRPEYARRAEALRLRGQALLALDRHADAADVLLEACNGSADEYWRMDYLRALCAMLKAAPTRPLEAAALHEASAIVAFTDAFDDTLHEPAFAPLRELPGFEAAKQQAIQKRAQSPVPLGTPKPYK